MLTTPADVAAVLKDKIVQAPVVASGSNLSTPGEASVTEAGTMQYRVPIWVPKGVRDMQPSLAVVYDSAGAAGVLGRKWGLAGFSSIWRCSKTMAEDHVLGHVQFNGDDFCLDGARLIRTSGNVNGTGEFRTRRNPYAKIVVTTANAGGVQAFQVYQPDGTISYYGRSNASRLLAALPSVQTGAVAAFYLDKTVDRYGNSILYTYAPQTLTGAEVNELVPTKITWGTTGDQVGQRSVVFNYVNKQTAGDAAHERWISGLGVRAGQRLQNLVISGPDGAGTVPILKVYRFGYTASPATDQELLSTITECDSGGACKRPTNITWESGSWQYSRTDLTNQGITDVVIDDGSAGDVQVNGSPIYTSNQYRRILVADLNRDGRDDIVYRTYATNAPAGSRPCLGWYARLAQSNGAFGAAIGLNLGDDPDPACKDGTTPYAPFPGDIVLADVNRDGFPDILSPAGKNTKGVKAGSPLGQVSYGAYLNSAGVTGMGMGGVVTNTVLFGGRIGFEDPYLNIYDGKCSWTGGSLDGSSPLIAFGDIDGDNYPDIVRPNYGIFGPICNNPPPRNGLSALSLLQTGGGSVSPVSVTPKTVPAAFQAGKSSYATGLSTVDIDGDGVAEILMDVFDSTKGTLTTYVGSPTLTGQIAMPPSNMQPAATGGTSTNVTRWLLDLNGDGLKDTAAIYGSDPNTIVTSISTGKGFTTTRSTALPLGARVSHGWQDGWENAARVVDYNLDGRQDLVLVDNGWDSSTTPGRATRSVLAVLLSDGVGGFTVLDTAAKGYSIPVGDPADGVVYRDTTKPLVAPGTHGYRTSVTLDVNGDGMPDFMQFEGHHLVLYTRQGKIPDMVTGIAEGTGKSVAATYLPVTDSAVYTYDPNGCGSDPSYTTCLVSGQWLVKSLSTYACNTNIAPTQYFTYRTGLYDKRGLGFVGFQQTDTFGPLTNHVRKSFSFDRKTVGSGYAYVSPFKPTTIETNVDTQQGTNNRHYTRQVNSYLFTLRSPTSTSTNAAYTVTPNVISVGTFDCSSQSAMMTPFGCSETTRTLRNKNETQTYDAFGNLTSDVADYYDSTLTRVQTDSTSTTFAADSTNTGLVRVPTLKQVTSTTYSPAESVTRTTKYTPDFSLSSAGFPKGDTQSLEIEPTGAPDAHLVRTFGRDTQGRLLSVADKSPATGDVRTTNYAYEDADGVYVTTTTDPKGFPTREWRHAGLGWLVEVDDPTGGKATFRYDSLGRKLAETKATGESTTYSYQDYTWSPLCQVASTAMPEGKSRRAINSFFDGFGNELQHSSNVDGQQTLGVSTTRDNTGRVTHSETYSQAGAAVTLLTTDDRAYDDMDRVISDCRSISGGGAVACRSNTYDGLSTTIVNEAGRVSTHVTDSFGRESRVTAAGTDASFTYGAFGLLRQEKASDGSGQTDITYDVLGRRKTLKRTGAGTRYFSYNAFGDVTANYKQLPDGTLTDKINYGRDALGRLTSITGANLGRQFYWDTPKGSMTPAPNAKGKLVDVTDATGTTIHFDYLPGGLVQKKTWSVSGAVFTATYTYDSQGRPSTVTYPKLASWSNPLSLTYSYDDYVGDVNTISDAPGHALWFSAIRDQFGRATLEDMGMLGGATIVRQAHSAMGTGLMDWASLAAPNGTVLETNTYYADNLLSSQSVSGSAVAQGYASMYYYDDLRRLTGFTLTSGANPVNVSYSYDGDGNLTSRYWSVPAAGGTITYTTVPGSGGAYDRTTRFEGSHGSPYTDVYRSDAWGRTYDTPAITAVYDAADELTSVTEKSSGQVDTILHDENGMRMVTNYGSASNGKPWAILYTLDDLVELRTSNTGSEERVRLRANGRLLGEIVRTSDTTERTGTFFLTDNVGSVVAEASSDGVITPRARRDPYGDLVSPATNPDLPRDPAAANPDGSSRMGFADHTRENNWGVVDMGARLYSPVLGRFLSPDPVLAEPLDRRSHNAFAYVRDNPMGGGDPLGMDGEFSDDLQQEQAETYLAYGAECVSLGETGAEAEVLKKKVSTGLQSSLGNPSAIDDASVNTGQMATVSATMMDDLASYDPSSPHTKAPEMPAPDPSESTLDDVRTPNDPTFTYTPGLPGTMWVPPGPLPSEVDLAGKLVRLAATLAKPIDGPTLESMGLKGAGYGLSAAYNLTEVLAGDTQKGASGLAKLGIGYYIGRVAGPMAGFAFGLITMQNDTGVEQFPGAPPGPTLIDLSSTAITGGYNNYIDYTRNLDLQMYTVYGF